MYVYFYTNYRHRIYFFFPNPPPPPSLKKIKYCTDLEQTAGFWSLALEMRIRGPVL
jgi:hypothetical protein